MAQIARRAPLGALPEVVCPAGLAIAGTTSANPGVLCRVAEIDRRKTSGVGLTPAQLAATRGYTARPDDGTVMNTLASDPSTVLRFCCGTGIPVVHGGEGQQRDHHSFCPFWQAEKFRIEEGRDELKRGSLEPDPTERFDGGEAAKEIAEAAAAEASGGHTGYDLADLDALVPGSDGSDLYDKE